MADIEKDIIIDTEELDDLIDKLSKKDKAVKEMLDKFIEALTILVEEGFKQGNRHKNMETFLTEVKNIRSQMDGILDSAQTTVEELKRSTESADKYLSVFKLY